MKNQFLTLATCALLLLAAGCKPKEEPVDPQKALYGNVPRPEWVALEDYDYTSSMTAVIRVDLAAQYPDAAADFVLDDQDLLAAFIGDECCGVATPQDGLFYLYINSPVTDNPSPVTLRYWSAHFKNLFVAADAFPYSNDSQQGSYTAPFVPNLIVVTD